ncbi:hypothetical protein ACFSB1_06160 [Halopseudomonas phragmitis]|uniref:Uncharacterized protein n=2 Tax=Pseudomonadaceae TaxID=135621 RepID=A0A1V0B7N6_9GAMM|nr:MULTISPECIES: hypothetical protein [Pseudomonadaceae]AQZ95939.1 hypothetical protein BVH74_14790 [Halopseudomonas phragmitis]PAU88882.1 hypothetical protein CK507_04180 [Pseudomonas sp. WN033]RHW21125.1 hypothetical protein C2846_10365 [Pseudomonas jilinensis]
MTVLVLYAHDQLACPQKLLTHDEDILAALAEQGIGLQRLAPVELAEQGDWLAAGQQMLREQLPGSDYSAGELRSYEGLPAYAEATSQSIEPACQHARPLGWLLLSGAGTLFLQRGTQILAVCCEAGSLLELPADTPLSFVPRVGQGCLLLCLASTPDDLRGQPLTADPFVGLEPLDL